MASVLLLSSSESDVVAAASSSRPRAAGSASPLVLVAGRRDEGSVGHRVLGLLAVRAGSLRSSGPRHRRRRSGSPGTRPGRRPRGAGPSETSNSWNSPGAIGAAGPGHLVDDLGDLAVVALDGLLERAGLDVRGPTRHRLHRDVRDGRVLGHVDLDAGRARVVSLVRHPERELGEAPLAAPRSDSRSHGPMPAPPAPTPPSRPPGPQRFLARARALLPPEPASVVG